MELELFPNIYGYEEIKESVLLQLVCNLKILLLGDVTCSKSSFLEIVKENFDFVKCIPDFNGTDLPSDKSVLAFTNPKRGRFNPCETIAEQVEIQPTLLNQFDVIFIIRDIPEKERDRKVAESILGELKKTDLSEIKGRIIRLRNIKPVWSEEAKKEMIDFYVKTRNSGNTKELTRIIISAKILKSLKNISEGYARLRESKEVSKEDVSKTIKLFNFWSTQVGYEK